MFTISELYQQGQRKYLLPEERQRLLHQCMQLPIPQQLFILLLLHTGCRISEGLELTPEGLDASAGYVLFRTLKQHGRRRFRAVPVPHPFMEQLLAIAPKDLDSRIWPMGRTQAWTWVKQALQLAGIEGPAASPKGLRHGFGVACVEAGIPVTLIQRWMGHTDLRTTAIYLQVSGAEERKQAQRLWSLEC